MMKIWNKLLILTLGSALPLCAIPSSISQPQLSSTNGLSLLLSDNSAFTIYGMFAGVTALWSSGDQIVLAQTDNTYFPPSPYNGGGIPVAVPMYILQNLTQNTSAIGYLNTQPHPNPIFLQQIDPNQGFISLGNATAWKIRPVDRRYFEDWKVGDIILIGENLGSDRGTYDAILFNTTRYDTARAYQMSP